MDSQEVKPDKHEELKEKIIALNQKIENSVPHQRKQEGIGVLIGILSDLLGGLIAGGVIGFVIYHFFETKLYILAIFIFLGGIAGVFNVYKYMHHLEKGRKE